MVTSRGLGTCAKSHGSYAEAPRPDMLCHGYCWEWLMVPLTVPGLGGFSCVLEPSGVLDALERPRGSVLSSPDQRLSVTRQDGVCRPGGFSS